MKIKRYKVDSRECKFTQGFVAACAATLRNHGCDTIVAETLVCYGPVSVVQYRKLGVEEYDIDILRPVIKEIQRKKYKERKDALGVHCRAKPKS